MTLPVPASTDPVADAAAHINALAAAITARLGSRSVAYWAGPVTTDGNGDFPVPGAAGVLSVVRGALIGEQGGLHLYRFHTPGAPGVAKARCSTYTGGNAGAVTVTLSVIAFGTPA